MNLPRIHPHHPLHRLIASHAHAHARRAAIAREYLAEARSSDTPAHLRPACLKAARRWAEDARRSYGQAKALLERNPITDAEAEDLRLRAQHEHSRIYAS